MSMYDDFLQSLLPGNYALTKSMELTKVQDSGTLWYTKKFLTLYYYVFLSNDIKTTAYQQAVIEIFDNYIHSLPEEVQEVAERYFYPEDEAINFKSANFNLFSNFASMTRFATQEERRAYYQRAKKYYFSLLMGSGGQTGIKKMIKEAVQRPGFVYSYANIDEIILRAAVDVCMREANAEHVITDNSVKYILSEETTQRACTMASRHPINEADIRQLNRDFPHPNPNYRGIENDMVAFLRNERQILYYYGYFHSKTTGANDFEFSSLTPIGEAALRANASEFLVIWEHQKIKMLSQPVTADINQVPVVTTPADEFGISYTPYTDLLGYLLRQETLTIDEYKYIVSRKKHHFDAELWEREETEIASHLGFIKTKVNAFGRKGDQKEEDGRKELLKYILGLRNDLSADSKTNPFGVLKFKRSVVSVDNKEALALIYRIYSQLDTYKISKYGKMFEDSEKDLRRRYVATAEGDPSTIDGKVKIYWDLYNIHLDKLVMLATTITFAAISLGCYDVENMSREESEAVCSFINDNFNGLLKVLGIRSVSAIKKEVSKVVLALKNGDYSNYLDVEEEHQEQTLAKYRTETTADLFTKIKQISAEASVSSAEDRVRNGALVSALKSYYLRCYATDNMLKCECCGEETFMTGAGEPYVEFHHLIPFSIAYGPDHYLNLFALCPNCHRKIHFLSTEDKREQYEDLSNNNYMDLSFVMRLRELKDQNLLRSYHLEFLLADNAITLEEYNVVAA